MLELIAPFALTCSFSSYPTSIDDVMDSGTLEPAIELVSPSDADVSFFRRKLTTLVFFFLPSALDLVTGRPFGPKPPDELDIEREEAIATKPGRAPFPSIEYVVLECVPLVDEGVDVGSLLSLVVAQALYIASRMEGVNKLKVLCESVRVASLSKLFDDNVSDSKSLLKENVCCGDPPFSACSLRFSKEDLADNDGPLFSVGFWAKGDRRVLLEAES